MLKEARTGKGRSGLQTAAANPPPQPPAPQPPQSADATKDLNELAQYMATKGVNLDVASLSGLTFENVREAAQGMERIIDEFPQAKTLVGNMSLKGVRTKNGVMAQAGFYGNVQVSDHYYAKSETQLGQTYDRSAKSGFHPAGTTKADIATHEMGHVLDSALIRKAIPGNSYWDKIDRANAWKKSTISGKVISEACKAVKKTPAGKGMKNAQLISAVSQYATANRAETLAECVADYAANGANAKPLSVAVWSILKRELG